MLVARLVLEEEQDLLFGAFGGNSVNGFASRASKTAANSLSTKEINTHSSVLTIETPFEKDVLSPLSATSKGCKCNEESWTEKLLKQECAMYACDGFFFLPPERSSWVAELKGGVTEPPWFAESLSTLSLGAPSRFSQPPLYWILPPSAMCEGLSHVSNRPKCTYAGP